MMKDTLDDWNTVIFWLPFSLHSEFGFEFGHVRIWVVGPRGVVIWYSCYGRTNTDLGMSKGLNNVQSMLPGFLAQIDVLEDKTLYVTANINV